MIDAEYAHPLSRLDGVTVLVVEDEAIVSFLIEDMLREIGCPTVWLASSVTGALTILKDHRPDVVVLDVNLSGQEAYPVAKQLVATQIPFVFATGYGYDGIDGGWASIPVIQKPFQIETLAKALRSVLNK